LTTASLFGKVREHELEMDKLNLQEHQEKQVRNITLKATGHKKSQDSSENSDGETFSLLSKKFSKFPKKNNNKKLNDFNINKYTCFGCGEQGHIKVDCPNKDNTNNESSRSFEKKGKSKKAYIAWDDNDVSSSSEDEKANMCLMTKGESESSSVSSNTSFNFENYSQLLEAFKETHEETNRLALLNNRFKGLNNWLEKRVKTLEEELINSKNDFENLELIYKNSSCECDSRFCENCDSLEKKVHYLVKNVDKLSKGKSNFENVFSSQQCVDWVLILTASKTSFKTFFYIFLKNNQLKSRNNQLLHAFTV